jgi:hypothetical protein
MAVKLSSLRVTAEMNVDQYVRAASQKVAADENMVGSAKAVGQSLAAVDAAASKTAPGVASLSRSWITGYGDAAKFESAVRSVGKAVDRGMDLGRAAVQLDGIYRKFGQTADAATLAKLGFTALAPVVSALNDRYETTAAIADRAAASIRRMTEAQKAQQDINARLGVVEPGANTSGAVYEVNRKAASSAGGDESQRAQDIAAYGAELDRVRAKYDPLFEAQQRYRAELTEVQKALKTGAINEQVYAKSVAATKSEFAGRVKELTGAAAAERDQEKALKEAAAAQTAQLKSLQALRVEYDQLAVAQERRTQAEVDLNKFVAAGLITEAQRGPILDSINKRYEETAAALNRTNVPVSKWLSGVGLARDELINLSRQAQDVFVSLASGQSPLTVLIQQGTQIADVFAASRGSVGGFLVQLMAWLGPLIPAIAAAGAAIAGLYSAFNVAGQRQDLSNSLIGVGRAAGVTGEQMNRLAVQAAASAEITVSSARSIAAEFAKTGTIASSNLTRLTQVTKDYAASTGQDMGNAAKELAAALADPSRGAETLNSKLGFLDSTTARAIRTATDYGDKLRAQKLLLDAVAQSTVAAEMAQSKWNQAWERYVTRPLDAAKEGIGGALIGADQRESVKLLDDQLKSLRSTLNSVTSGSEGRFQSQQRTAIAAVEARKAALENLIATQERQAKTGQANVESAGRTRAADELLQGVQKDQMAYQLAVRAVTVYEASIGELIKKRNELVAQGDLNQGINQQKFAEINTQIRQQTEGLDRAKNQVKDYAVATQGLTVEQNKARLVDEIRLRAVNDITPAQRAATAAEIARIGQLGTATTAAERAAEADRARRDVQIDAAKATADATRASNDNAGSLNAQAEAARRSGTASAEAARLRAAAAVEARGTGQSEQVVFERLLREALADTNKELAQKSAQNKEVASAERAANAQAKASGLSEAQRAEVLQRISALQETRAKLIALGVTDERELRKATDETTRAIVEKNSAEAQARALGMLYGQNEQIAGLEREIALIGQGRDARRESLAVLQAEQDLRRSNIALGSEEGQRYVENAKKIAALTTQLDATRKAYDGIRQAQDFVADGFKAFVEELITGTEGINGALKALGKGFLSASLDALISGKGPLAGITGLASNDNTKQGGLLGLASGNSIGAVVKAIKTGAAEGSEKGVSGGIESLGSGGFSLLGGIDAKALTGGITALAGLAGAYGIGQSAGSVGQAIGGGAISGGMGGLALAGTGIGASLGGAAVLGPLGAIAGGALAYFGNQQKKAAEKAERERVALENYNNAKPQIASFRSQARGDPQGTLRQSIAESATSARQFADVAFLAKKTDEARAIWGDFLTYEKRTLDKFSSSWYGVVDSLRSGLGPDSPFTQARDRVESLGESLKGFIDNTSYAFAGDTDKLNSARDAARAYALQVLDSAKVLSNVGTRMAEIQGAAAGLQQVLGDLGFSADEAAAAISTGVTAAMARLKVAFEDDVISKTRSASGAGYLNDIGNLFSEIAMMRADAAALGTDQGLVTNYFTARAQELVNGANLTGQAFSDLLAQFPGLIGYVREAGFVIDNTARLIEAASRRLAYQDRIFNALNDNTTLAGQLAAFDRAAARERAEEIRLGGDAINDLEGALAAERLKIITDFADAAADEQRRALEEAQNFFDTFSRNLRQFVDGLRSGSDSPLSPEARLAAAQGQYNAQLALAQGGDRDAINGLTTYASALLEAGEAFYASSAGYQQIFDQVTTQLLALPTQVSAEQFIVDAIENAANATISAIDTNGDGFISLQEATNANLGSIFSELDINGDGQISALELIRGAARDTANEVDYQSTIIGQTQNILASANSLAASANSLLSTQAALLDQIRALQSTSQQTLDVLRGEFTNNNSITLGGVNINNNMREALNKIVFNTASGVIAASGTLGAPYVYASGGYVSGPGTSTSDSISARLSNGEFVMRAAAVDRFGVGMLDQMNDNFSMPAMPVPLPMVASGGGTAAENRMLREELRAMRQELADIKRAVVAGAMHVREGVDAGTSVQREVVRETKFKKKAA